MKSKRNRLLKAKHRGRCWAQIWSRWRREMMIWWRTWNSQIRTERDWRCVVYSPLVINMFPYAPLYFYNVWIKTKTTYLLQVMLCDNKNMHLFKRFLWSCHCFEMCRCLYRHSMGRLGEGGESTGSAPSIGLPGSRIIRCQAVLPRWRERKRRNREQPVLSPKHLSPPVDSRHFLQRLGFFRNV